MALPTVLDLVDPEATGLDCRLVGTAAAVAQGVSLPASDVDILARQRSDVDRFAAALAEFPCLTRPVWLAEAQQYFARFDVNGADVEISTVEWPAATDTIECAGSGPWRHFTRIAYGRHILAVVSLELRLVSELVRDRPDRYEPLIKHLRLHGADVELVLRSMRDRAVDPILQKHVSSQLQLR